MQAIRIFVLAVACLSAVACEPMVDRRGHVADAAIKQWVVVGSTTKDEVLREFGSPSTVSNFGDETWYYIQSRKVARGFLKPETTNQKVVQLTFDSAGVASKVDEYDAADAKQVQMVSKTTPTEGHSLGFFEQVLGNLGRFNKPREAPTPGRR